MMNMKACEVYMTRMQQKTREIFTGCFSFVALMTRATDNQSCQYVRFFFWRPIIKPFYSH